MTQGYAPDARRLTLKATAYHEAGHAFSALSLGLRFSKVWILQRAESDTLPDGTIIGEVTRSSIVDKPSFFGKLNAAKDEVVQAMAGPLAECLPYAGMQPDWQLNASDMRVATSILKFALLTFTLNESGEAKFDDAESRRVQPQIQRILEECYARTADLISGNVPAIVRIAETLLTRWELTEEEARAIIQSEDTGTRITEEKGQ